jgi:hypothetical protein
LIRFRLNLRIIGRIKIEDIIVIKRHINKRRPMDEVPSWLEMDNVEKEPIVVAALKNIALGVLLLITRSISKPELINLFIKYIGKEIPRL